MGREVLAETIWRCRFQRDPFNRNLDGKITRRTLYGSGPIEDPVVAGTRDHQISTRSSGAK